MLDGASAVLSLALFLSTLTSLPPFIRTSTAQLTVSYIIVEIPKRQIFRRTVTTITTTTLARTTMSSSSTTPLAQSASTPTSVTDHVAPKSFPLLDLPDELILQVLKHAVVTSSEDIVIPVLKGRRLDPPEPELHLAQPAITRVSRAFRCEGIMSTLSHEENSIK